MKFGTDGVRGVAHEELTTDFATTLARAAARVLCRDGCRQVVIGGDTRESTPAFIEALTRGFSESGIDVLRMGVASTPAVAFEAQQRQAMGAVVSASHNPWHDNGIKLFAPGGVKLPDDVEAQIESEIESDRVPTGPVGSITELGEDTAYADHVLAILEGRTLSGLKVVLDTANGAATSIAPGILRAAGAEVVVVAAEPDGRNINDGCGATHPEHVGAAVIEHGADVGIALDGDADRLIAVDHAGQVVDGDHVIAICALDRRARGLLTNDTVVVTVMTNLGFRLAMEAAGVNVVETGVGDRYVLAALAAGGHSLGGEQSGHVIFSDHATTGDGVLTALALLDVVRRDVRPLGDIARDTMRSLPQVLVNVRVAARVHDVDHAMSADVARVESMLGPTGRVLLRASGTEPLIRVMVEAETEALAREVADDLAGIVAERFT